MFSTNVRYEWQSTQRRRAIRRPQPNLSRSNSLESPVHPRHSPRPSTLYSPTTARKTIQGEIKIQAENGETRVLRSAPDWTESAINGDHLWVSSNTSGSDLCYVGERECLKTGPRLCCPVCKVIAHTGCISILIDKMKIHCKPTFKDGVRQYRESNSN
ncbi:hypothetical protein TYRP_014303 [Tyrophagus putrescentiae]|nr:hypothetical protein TYRP_014303 [Tyrophagus putrescentiae]